MNKEQANCFEIKDCDLAEIATGRRAQNLRELRDVLQSIDNASIHYHFWGSLLRPRFVEPEFNNDFAAWASHALHDGPMAERLAVIDPTAFKDPEELRRELIEVLEGRLDESASLPWARQDQQFYFMRSQIVVFNTRRRLSRPSELAQEIGRFSPGSIFYHVIDARQRDPDGSDDFRAWLAEFGPDFDPLRDALANIDPYFDSLVALRQRIAAAIHEFFGGSRS